MQSNTQPPGNECDHGNRNKTNPPQNQGEIVACHEWPNLIVNNLHHAEDNRSENRVADKMFQSLWHFTLNTKYDEKFLRREDEKLEAPFTQPAA